MSYLRRASTARTTPQSEPLPGQEQNPAGGYVWRIPSMERLRRFLILGSEGGSYYVNERDLTAENIAGVRLALAEHGRAAVAEIVDVSRRGAAPKNDPALYALAIAIADKDPEVRSAAAEALPLVARTGTHLFMFAHFAQSQRGWGRTLRWAISNWYQAKGVTELAYPVVKYRQREGWTHRDLLRKAHPSPPTPEHALLYNWICGRGHDEPLPEGFLPVEAYQRAQTMPDAKSTAQLVREYAGSLPREALITDHLSSPEVWQAMLDVGMPMTAMLRNLANMTRVGVIAPMSSGSQIVTDALRNGEAIRRSRLHPVGILGALITYQRGFGARGSNTWDPDARVIDALNDAFYLSFENVPTTGKRTLLALDVSGSMEVGNIGGMPGLTPRMGTAAMAMCQARSGDPWHCVGFQGSLVPLSISPSQRLDDVLATISDLPFGRTDCAQPMLYAEASRLECDTFVVYTDNETWAGAIHPAQALERYRQKLGIPARLVVVGMVASPFSIADPNDAGMLDVVGFDPAVPRVIADFSTGWAG